MTFWIAAGVLLVVLLGAMAAMDRRARRRGARVRGDIGEGVVRGSNSQAVNEARVRDGQRQGGNSLGL